MFPLLFLAAVITSYVGVNYYNYRKLKSRVEKWSQNMGFWLWFGIGRNKFIFISLEASPQRATLKKRIGGYGNEASDNDLYLIL